MKCRKIRAVIRFHTPNKQKEPEKFFHHLLMLYFPWRNELADLTGTQETYASKFCEPEVQAIVDVNREKFEPDAEAVAEVLEFLRNNDLGSLHSYDSLNDQQNEDMQSEWQGNSPLSESFNEQPPEHLAQAVNPVQSREPCSGVVSHNQPSNISDDILRESVRSLNSQQRCAYDTVLTWCRTRVMNMNSLQPNEIEPLNLFITGGAGTGKSHTIKTIFHTAVKTFRHTTLNPEMTTVLLVAPTGVTAVNIDGTTISSALAIPKDVGDTLPAMSDQKKTHLRMSLAELKLIIIDGVSMVANTTLLNIHQRLKEIFVTPNSKLFAGVSILAAGDLYQLPPIRKKPVFENYKNDGYNLCHPWHVFMIELVKIMRQKNDKEFTALLNRIRTASQSQNDIKCLQNKSASSHDNYPTNALHIWA